MTTKSHALEDKYKAEAVQAKEETQSTSLEKLPSPTGWRILVMPFKVKEKTELAQLTMDSTRLAKIKELQEKTPAVTEEPKAPAQAPTQPQQVDPRADAWASKNPWFGSDNAMTYTAFDIHKKLVEEEGFDPQSNEYYSEVDKRIRLEFPHKFDKVEESTQSAPTQNVASARRPAAQGRRKTVKLTPSQVAISKRLGVPLEEYAKQLAAKEV